MKNAKDIVCSKPNFYIGASTVTSKNQVELCYSYGAQFISTRYFSPQIIESTLSLSMVPLPGIKDIVEAHKAVDLGANWVKFYPASDIGVEGLKIIRKYLPSDIGIIVAGGVTPESMEQFWACGANGFAIGSTLFSKDLRLEDLKAKAYKFGLAFSKLRHAPA
mmetsp:Transcript_16153/g.23960  ORF Transcript_16153/g.23960 Transcript_16153/m.23960 type:complete len:163 (+) Transcript_16153:13-501(+)